MASDARNLHWRDNNVGSKLLAKMGWQEGEGVGKRHKEATSEGIRVRKRAEGLGLGASAASTTSGGSQVQDFGSLLASLHKEHKVVSSKKKKTVLPTNKQTHHKVRAAKFQKKTADDMKAIFAGHETTAVAKTKKSKKEKKAKKKE